jgi:hypothetical protein
VVVEVSHALVVLEVVLLVMLWEGHPVEGVAVLVLPQRRKQEDEEAVEEEHL